MAKERAIEGGGSNTRARPSATREDRYLLAGLLIALLVALSLVLAIGIAQAQENYGEGIRTARDYFDRFGSEPEFRPDLSLLYMLQNSRATDGLFLRISALVLSYSLVLVGCLFVLTGIRTYYSLVLEGREMKSALQTASPGLVLITLGCMLAGLTIVSKSTVDTQFAWGGVIMPVPTQAVSEEGADGSDIAYEPLFVYEESEEPASADKGKSE